MDPLEELKSLLNIPEGMTADEANENGITAGLKAFSAGVTNGDSHRAIHLALEHAWFAISLALESADAA